MSGERIQAALNKLKVDALPDDLYRFMDVDDPDLSLILRAFNIEIPAKLYRKAELKSIKTGTKVFMWEIKSRHIFSKTKRIRNTAFCA